MKPHCSDSPEPVRSPLLDRATQVSPETPVNMRQLRFELVTPIGLPVELPSIRLVAVGQPLHRLSRDALEEVGYCPGLRHHIQER